MISNARSWLAMVVISACLGGKYAGSLGVYTEGVNIYVDEEKRCGVWACNGTGPSTSPPNSVDNVMPCHDVTLATISRSTLPFTRHDPCPDVLASLKLLRNSKAQFPIADTHWGPLSSKDSNRS